ncbi:Demethylmenaquinone methyltransferase [Diplogelasinospora grovesii]|uniref:Demethylmenaquinone methyltransferase n=1 Tax=Diplogelasinospora grovesii TaxID=303347 RepID=A0AAN6S5E3_9PEZI|nr:Demethylmenaquinone methyltransferase [Diplogelasinospora grovesii]
MQSGEGTPVNGTQKSHWEEDPPLQGTGGGVNGDGDLHSFSNGVLEVDSDNSHPSDLAAPYPDPHLSGLEVGLEVDEDEPDETASVYAMSAYPRVSPAFRVEQPYENGNALDSATIDSSRTLYADDFDFVVEHGRQYCGDYFMPIDPTEQTRQYVIHQVYLKLFNLELTTVPLDNPKYILDIGTGIGEWAIGMAEKHPECEVFGTDIAPIQPTQQVPFNVEFHIENAEDEWIRPADAVDLVHLRNMTGAFSDWRFIYGQAFNCIKPGGWIEIIDFDDYYAYENFLGMYPNGSPAHILVNAVYEAAQMSGRPRGVEHMSQQLLIDAGFVDIGESKYDLGLGTRENSSFGKFWLFAVVTGIEASCMRLLTRQMGWDEDYVRDLCDKVAHETKMLAEDPARAQRFVVKLRVLVGRKPTVSGQWTAKALNENAKITVNNGELSGDDSTIGSRAGRSEETL